MIDRRLRLLLCAHLVVVVAASVGAAQNRISGSVEGVITRTGGTEPVPNVTVALATPPSLSTRNTPHIGTTDAAGKFIIEGVPPASYNLIIRADNFYRPQRSGPLSVRIQAGERLRNVHVSLTPTATVSGKILDENGEPTAARVHLEQVRFVDGIRTIGRDQGAVLPTDDRGEFRLTEVPVGRYYLRADPPIGPLNFSPVYYPGVPNPEDGAVIDVGPGADLRGFDFQLLHKDVHRVRLKISTPEPLPDGTEVSFYIRPVGRRYQVAQTITDFEKLPDGTYVSNAMAVGQYVLDVDARIPSPTRWPVFQARVPVEIHDKDVDLGTVLLKIGPSIPGKIVLKDATLPTGSTLAVRLVTLDQRNGTPPRAEVDASGTFLIDRAPLQRLLGVTLGSAPPDFYIESARYAGNDVLAGGFLVTEDRGPLEIVVTGPFGVVTGTVRNSKEEPFAQIRVVLVPAANRRGPAVRFPTSMSDESGNFSIPRVPAGDYAVLALEDNIPLGNAFLTYSDFYEDPEFLQEFESKAVKVTVARGGNPNVTVHSVFVPDYR